MLALSSSWANYFAALGYNYINYIKSGIGLLVIGLLLIFLIPIYGIIGAAVATSVGYTISSLVLCYYYYFKNPVC